eukprot:7386809-Prymnesium_polylepis.1
MTLFSRFAREPTPSTRHGVLRHGPLEAAEGLHVQLYSETCADCGQATTRWRRRSCVNSRLPAAPKVPWWGLAGSCALSSRT